MILSFADLEQMRGQVAMVDGAFDPLHTGHIEYFKAADALGLPLLCNVASDHYVRTKHPPLLPAEQRVAIVDAIRYIAYTHLSELDTKTVLTQLRPRYYVKGSDWQGSLPARQIEICRSHSIEIIYVDTVRDSSSRILDRFTERTRNHVP